MTNEEKQREFHEKLEAAGHTLIRNEDGSVDIMQHCTGIHNGPGCSNCHQSWCHHYRCRDMAILPCAKVQ